MDEDKPIKVYFWLKNSTLLRLGEYKKAILGADAKKEITDDDLLTFLLDNQGVI